MSYDDEQCPKRGPGLPHAPDEHLTCRECGQQKTSGFTLTDWMRAFSAGPVTPRVVKVSGEPDPEPPDEMKHGLNGLTARQWHALIVERRYREEHPESRG